MSLWLCRIFRSVYFPRVSLFGSCAWVSLSMVIGIGLLRLCADDDFVNKFMRTVSRERRIRVVVVEMK